MEVAQIDEAAREVDIMKHLKETDYDLIVLDISLVETDFTRIMENIAINQKTARVLIFSMYPEEIYGIRCLQLGAKGYIRKTSSDEEISFAIKRVLEGKKYISHDLADLLSSIDSENTTNPFKSLSSKELEIAKHLNDGMSLLQIANILNIQYSTVNTYKRRLLEKLCVDSVLSMSRLMKLFEI